jgi:hypothetical protein
VAPGDWISVDDEVSKAAERTRDGVAQVSSDLRHPLAARLVRDSGDMDASRFEVDHEQHHVAHQTADRKHFDGEEVRRGDGAPVRFQKRVPRHAFPAHRRGLDAMFFEDPLNGRASEVQAQVPERAAKTRVAPRWVLARHGQQLLDSVGARTRTPRTAPARAVVLDGDLLSIPAQGRLGCRERRHRGQSRPAKRLSFLRKKASLGVGESKALGPTRTRSTRFSTSIRSLRPARGRASWRRAE